MLKYMLGSVMLAISLLGQTAIAPAAGDGSSGNPYQITSIENLYWLSQQEGNSDGVNLYWTRNYIQTNLY